MEKKKCCVKGCVRQIDCKKHALCKAHLNQWYKTGKVKEGKVVTRIKHEPFVGWGK